MTMCGRVLFGIGGCLALITSIQLIVAVASPAFAMKINGAEGKARTAQFWGLSEAGSYCWSPECIDQYKEGIKDEAAWEKSCKLTEKINDSSCSASYKDFSCFCSYGDKDKDLKIFKAGDNVCDPNSPTNKGHSDCDKFQYKDNEEVFDAAWSSRGMTMMMLIVAIIFSILMTITSYASAALLHPIGGWVTVCLAAMTMVFSIIGIMTSMTFGSLITTLSACGNWDCYSAKIDSSLTAGPQIVASAYLSQLMILIGAIQTYIALCLVTIATFVAKKASSDGALGEKLT